MKLWTVIQLILFLYLISPISGFTQTNKPVHAWIGIKLHSQNQIKQAKANERLLSSDSLQIYVKPDSSADFSHVYIIYADEKSGDVKVLNASQLKVAAGQILITPNPHDYYTLDPSAKPYTITIVVSPQNLPKLTQLFAGKPDYKSWRLLEAALDKQSRIQLTDKPEVPMTMAASVRGTNDPFLAKLKPFSGNDLIVKKYQFSVTK